MGPPSRPRSRDSCGAGKRSVRGLSPNLDSRRSNRISASSNFAKPSSPIPGTSLGTPSDRKVKVKESLSASEDIAAEIVVWTGDIMNVDSPESSTPAPPEISNPPDVVVEDMQVEPVESPSSSPLSHPSPSPSIQASPSLSLEPSPSLPLEPSPSIPFEPSPSIPPDASSALPLDLPTPLPHDLPPPTLPSSPPAPASEVVISPFVDDDVAPKAESSSSSLSAVSDHSDLSPVLSSVSSKATTPVDNESFKEAMAPAVAQPASQVTDKPRRRYDVRPKVSIPPDLTLYEYATQCIAGAEASRLNPYALHPEEYSMLRDHISHTQVTTYLNIRNGILRLWVRNPQIAVTRDEAIGCAKDSRWFDVASLSFDWLVRRGYINFGCVEIRSSRKPVAENSPTERKQKTVVVIGAGMSGLGCARQLEGLFKQYSRRFREMGEEPPRVVVLEGRSRVGGRVYSRSFTTKPKEISPHFEGKRYTAEMGGMIITGFDRGNPINILLRGQLGLDYHKLNPDMTLYDSNGKPVDLERDQLVEKLYNDCLERVSEYKFQQPTSKLIEGNRDLIDEGRDSSAETHKTIRQAEEAAAAQPYAAPVSEQNMAPQVHLVPVSSDRATGKVHTEPGTPGAQKAAHRVKDIGWTLKHGVSDDADLEIEPLTKEPNATLGSVIDKIIPQYRDLVDFTAQDFRLMNWHVANLEYSNATNYNQLSLKGWDIDAGNEWEGAHTMVVGGYQSVPRGLALLPTPLNLKQKSPVQKITYSPENTGKATVECEDGYKVEADYVVNTIPLGVLKHGNVQFDPPLPSWKADAINRLGFGVLNKVILVYKEPFWDENRDIFGVLRIPSSRHSLEQKDYSSQRGRFFQWFNISKPSGLPVLLALMAGDAGYDTEQSCNDDLVAEATEVLRSVYGSRVPKQPVEAVVTRWASDKFARGSYSSAGPTMEADDYDTMARPIGNLYFAGEHTSGTHPATVHGAYLSGLRAASEVLDAMLGPIEIPTPLIIPKNHSSLKRKASGVNNKDSFEARLQQYEIDMWDHIVSLIDRRPLIPTKPASNAYIFFSKSNYDNARKKLEEGRRPGKGKPSANEVRVMSAKMWKETTEEEKRPFVEMVEEQKRAYAEKMTEWKKLAAEWDEKATELRLKYESEHPVPVANEQEGEGNKRRRGTGVESYAEPDEDEGIVDEEEDVIMEG
ncbi:flavin-containing amine oxidoreductase-domain containing protein [Apiosordaria backusii]|uniref:Flavin-containing amine oxidoreductase-domain containing protein n=1 Tax=Apiosordaria backusii TaxID=314023 RepID=A0AA40B7G5_9PEZI|nr:flavin-containing amine oxidoreductase-domain containing protein [Apiosordaria backusii]